MNIPPATLAKQFYRAREAWPFLDDIERAHGLPRCLLYAVGSRETNLTDELGDGGHGHGPWQFDTHPQNATPERLATASRIDAGDVEFAAEVAAETLAGLFAHYGEWTAACNAYNSGQPKTSRTTGHDYGPDVMDRCRFLADLASPTPAPAPAPSPEPAVEDDMPKVTVDPATGDFWVLQGPDGSLGAYEATGLPSRRYYGNLLDHPEYNAGPGKPLGEAFDIAFWPQGAGLPGLPPGGYVIFTRDAAGGVHPYHFDAGTLPKAS